jgi:hypothetical protein
MGIMGAVYQAGISNLDAQYLPSIGKFTGTLVDHRYLGARLGVLVMKIQRRAKPKFLLLRA